MASLRSYRRMLQNAAVGVKRRLEQSGVAPLEIEEALRGFFASAEFDRAAGQYVFRMTPQPVLIEPLTFIPAGDPIGVDVDCDFYPAISRAPRYVGQPDPSRQGVVSALLQPGYFNRGWTEEELAQWLSEQGQYRGAGACAIHPFQRAYIDEPRPLHCFFPDPPVSRWLDETNEVAFPALHRNGTISLFPIKKKMRRNDCVVLGVES